MRTVLFAIEDSSLLNRIKVILHDQSAQFFFAGTGDEAVALAEKNEIAVAMVSLSMPVMDGAELVEFFLDKNPRTQILMLFGEEDTERVVKLHNQHHLCRILCRDILALDEIPKNIEDALFCYNKDSELKKIELSYREKEEKYKKTMFEMSALLNDRMESYQEVIRLFAIYGRFLIKNKRPSLSDSFINSVISYLEKLLQDFVQLYLLRESKRQDFFDAVVKKYHNPEIRKYFKIIDEVPEKEDLSGDVFQNMSFLMSMLTSYFHQFYSEYRGKIVVSKTPQYYLLNVLYDVKQLDELKLAGEILFTLNEKIVSSYAAKAAHGSKDSIIQFKLYFLKEEQKA